MEEKNPFESVYQNRRSHVPKPPAPLPPSPKPQVVAEPPAKRERLSSVMPIHTLNEYALDQSGKQDVIFIKRLEETGRQNETQIRKVAPMTEVLLFVARLPQQPLWFHQSQEAIINSKTMNFPEMDVLTRAYIRDSFRTPLNGEPAM